jgi:hypothetical protein
MPINKSANIRYMTIDRCLCNTGKYFIKDLLEEIEMALTDEYESSKDPNKKIGECPPIALVFRQRPIKLRGAFGNGRMIRPANYPFSEV